MGLADLATGFFKDKLTEGIGGASDALKSIGVGAGLMTTGMMGGGNGDPNSATANYLVTIRQEPTSAFPNVREVRAHVPENFNMDSRSEYDTPYSDSLIPNRKIGLIAQLAGWSPTVQAMSAHFWKGNSPIEISLPLTLVAYADPKEITTALFMLKSMQMPTVDKKTKFLRAPGPLLTLNKDAASKLGSDTLSVGTLAGELVTSNLASSAVAAAKGGIGGLVNGALGAVNGAIGAVNGAISTVNNITGLKLPSVGASSPANKVDSDKMDTAGAKVKEAMGEVASDIAGLITVTGKISIKIGKFLYFEDVVITGVSEEYQVVLAPDGRPQKVTVTVTGVTRLTPTFEDLAAIYQTTNPLTSGGK